MSAQLIQRSMPTYFGIFFKCFLKKTFLEHTEKSVDSWIWTKVCPIENNTNLKSVFCLIKSSKFDLIFYLHFTWLCGSWHHQTILKNSHFEKMSAGFLLRCQNLLRRNTPEIMHFQAWNFLSSPILLLFSPNVVCIVSRWYFDQFGGP